MILISEYIFFLIFPYYKKITYWYQILKKLISLKLVWLLTRVDIYSPSLKGTNKSGFKTTV